MARELPEILFRQLVDNLAVGVMVDDSQGKIHYSNKAFRRIFKLEPEQVAFYDFADLTAPEHKNDLLKLHLRRLSGQSVPDSVDFTGMRTDGSRVLLEASVSMFQHEDIVYFLTILRDVSQVRLKNVAAVQDAVFESSVRICENALGSLEKLLRAGTLARAGGAYSNTGLLRGRLSSVLKSSNEEDTEIDAGMVVLETAGKVEEMKPKGIKVTFSVDPDIPKVPVHLNTLEHILMNIVWNSIDSMGKEGEIYLHAGVEEDLGSSAGTPEFIKAFKWVSIVIRDTGPGMDEALLSKASQPFFTTKDVRIHSGMGLFEVYRGMRAMGGLVQISSTPGTGTTVRLLFPSSVVVQDENGGDQLTQ